MSGKPAARITDFHVCPMVTPAPVPVPHVGGTILGPGAPTVLIGGLPAARIGDTAICIGPPNSIVAGAYPVPIFSSPAARMTDSMAHGGVIVWGDFTVLIGLAGTAGNVAAGIAMCKAAASGRTSNKTKQTYNNCGVESSRQLINQSPPGANVSENTLLQNSINSGLAAGTPGSPPVRANGGTGPADRQAILAANGVSSTVADTTPQNLGMAMSQGKGTIVSLDAAVLWGPPQAAGSLHAVTVTGVEYDDAGNRVAVYINDTGTGKCGQRVPVDTFDKATGAHPASKLNITDKPIW